MSSLYQYFLYTLKFPIPRKEYDWLHQTVRKKEETKKDFFFFTWSWERVGKSELERVEYHGASPREVLGIYTLSFSSTSSFWQRKDLLCVRFHIAWEETGWERISNSALLGRYRQKEKKKKKSSVYMKSHHLCMDGCIRHSAVSFREKKRF